MAIATSVFALTNGESEGEQSSCHYLLYCHIRHFQFGHWLN